MNFPDLLILAVKCLAVFIFSAAGFDVVHYILHVWEDSRFPLLRFLGGLHSVHHDFLDRQMTIQRQYTRLNLVNHVIPEFMTAVAGMVILSFIFGYLPAVIVLALRSLMLAVYLLQKGEDFTHKSVKRINAQRSLIFVGPNYHALHHVYVKQYYSSFINIFDLLFGTNCQIRERKFLISGVATEYGKAMAEALRAQGAEVQEASEAGLKTQLQSAEVLVLAQEGFAGVSNADLISSLVTAGKERLMPPEVWAVNSAQKETRLYRSSVDVVYRNIALKPFTVARLAVAWDLFFIKRGF